MAKNCKTILNNKKLKVDDPDGGRSVLYIDNPSKKKLEKTKIDGCEIVHGYKCDWLIREIQFKKNRKAKTHVYLFEIFVELKGSDVKHGFDQIDRAIKLLSKMESRKAYIIFYSRCPLSTSDLQRRKLKFRQKHNTTIEVKRSNIEIKV